MRTVCRRPAIAAWNDEAHVRENRAQYAQKFATVTPLLAERARRAPARRRRSTCGPTSRARGLTDTEFAQRLYAEYNVTVLPGSVSRARLRTASIPAATSSAWRWSPTSTNASKRRAAHRRVLPASLELTTAHSTPSQLTSIPRHVATTSADHRHRLGKPRRDLSPKAAPAEVRDAVAHVIERPRQRRAARRREDRTATGSSTSGSRRPCCCRSAWTTTRRCRPAATRSSTTRCRSKFANYTRRRLRRAAASASCRRPSRAAARSSRRTSC